MNIQHKEDCTKSGIDKWIEAIPNNNYDLCPCGCGKKFKFVLPEIEKHQNAFIAKIERE